MVSILVIYGTGEGQTAKIAETVADAIEERGHETTVTDVAADSGSVDVDDFDAVLVGASIHVGKQQAAVRTFATDHRDALESRPTGFFQVSLSSATDDDTRRAEAAGYVDAFVEETGWQPDRVGLFGGALRYSKYGFLKRLVMKRIAREATGDTDASRDYEYTDWEEVEAFANDFAAFVEGRLGVAPPSSE
ncbi:protoporphyrinogen oxidase (plasmid) [Haloterrigena turkmenica DSM 5511]|uniref:Protoporphyrinogen oxidase n=1 Tax=Haloterrigena turkmenica (strain ATCC 51198 / DSM 5511 / JCM 9101 / NCIMB 13204 / VKM B-1734 / 4k) TaxID=543526 RepID=D2S193_HALTV|nr:menaquinone-dependent protoporphyrinogen IX dehydrogenase [Haloterrigena turkmenica]ADB63140.1 protoporphyrinogen oxidase [Haloterrigena turkmenica DSM 5511]